MYKVRFPPAKDTFERLTCDRFNMLDVVSVSSLCLISVSSAIKHLSQSEIRRWSFNQDTVGQIHVKNVSRLNSLHGISYLLNEWNLNTRPGSDSLLLISRSSFAAGTEEHVCPSWLMTRPSFRFYAFKCAVWDAGQARRKITSFLN